MPKRHIVFDVNETLLDLSALDPIFADLFGDSATRRTWFMSLLHWSTVTTLTGQYMDFSQLAAHCLNALAADRGITLSDTQSQRVFDTVATLAPHPDVADTLDRLRKSGFTIVALTNSAQKTVDTQFRNAGLTDRFDHVLSVDTARCYKPHPSAYAVASDTLRCRSADLRLVACHDWDVTGAMRAGLSGAYVARDGRLPNKAGDLPDVSGTDLSEVADRIIAADG